MVRSKLSPAVYRVRPTSYGGNSKEVSLHLVYLKPYHSQSKLPPPDFDTFGERFLGKAIPLPDLQPDLEALPRIESIIIEKVIGHQRAPGRLGPPIK